MASGGLWALSPQQWLPRNLTYPAHWWACRLSWTHRLRPLTAWVPAHNIPRMRLISKPCSELSPQRRTWRLWCCGWRVEEQHRRDFQQLRAEVQHLDGRLVKGESAVSALEKQVAQLEQSHTSHQADLAELQLHLEDQENRSRRNNLRPRGLPEATGPENLQETVRAILHKILNSDPPATMDFDRVHRVLGPKSSDLGATIGVAAAHSEETTRRPGPRSDERS